MTRARTLLLLSALYLSQGLPYGFFSQALPVLMREAGYSLVKIGATTLLFLPWSLKFLWAPYIDRYGTRRNWLFALQFGAAGVALVMATLELSDSLRFVFLALFLFNLLAATQDVATDGLAVVLLAPRDRGIGNAIQTGGYRLGMVIGGGLLLWVYTVAGWRFMFVAMAAMLAALLLPVFSLREPPKAPLPPAQNFLSVAGTSWSRLRRPGIPLLLVLVCFFKFGDSMGAALVGPFMKDIGITLQQIALIKGTVASVCGLIGAALGGWLAWRYGRRVALLFGGLTQTASLVGYALVALGIGGTPLLISACVAEHILGGAATVALFTLMMDAAEPEHAGTDYTLLACTVIFAQGFASFSAGVIAEHGGYALMFGLSTLLSAAGCLTLIAAVDRHAGPERLQTVWRLPRPVKPAPDSGAV